MRVHSRYSAHTGTANRAEGRTVAARPSNAPLPATAQGERSVTTRKAAAVVISMNVVSVATYCSSAISHRSSSTTAAAGTASFLGTSRRSRSA